MLTTAQQGVQSLQGIGAALGSQNPFAPIMSSINGLGTGLSIIQQNSGPAAAGLSNVARAGGMMMGIGAAIAGISAGLQALAGPIQQSQAALNQVLQNVGHSLTEVTANGRTVGQMFGDAEKRAASFGFSMSGVDDALTRLTAITKDPTEAVKELNLAELITTQTHGSLTSAAQMLGQAHGGMYRQFRQFGLDLPNINTQLADTAKAETAVTESSNKLASAEKNLADYNDQLSQKLQAQKDAWAQKVQNANQAAQDSDQRYTEQVEAYNQRKETDEANWAQAVQNATDAVGTAEQNLADLEARQAAEEADRQAQRQEQIENETQSLQDAQERRAQLIQRQTVEGPSRTASDQVQRQQELANATEAVQKQQEKLNDLTTKPLDSQSQALSQEEALRKAKDAVNNSQNSLNTAVTKQQEGEAALAIQYQSVLASQQKANEAKAKAAQIEAEAAKAGEATSAEIEKQRHLQEAVATAQERQQKAQANLAASQAEQNKLAENFQKIEDFLTQRYGGVLEARRKTTAGWLAAMKADITNWLGTEGSTIAQIGLGIGSAIAGAGGIARMGQTLAKIPELFKKTAKDTEGPVGELEGVIKGGGPGGAGGVAGATEEMGTAAAETAPSFIASIGSMMAVAAPIAAIVAAIALVAYAGYDIVKNWKMISEDLNRGWGKIEAFAKEIWGDITGFFRKWWPEILGVMTGGVGLIVVEIVKHWHDIENFGKEIWGDITGFFRRFWPELLAVFTGGGSLIVKFVIDHWTDIKRIFSEGVDHVLGFFRDLPGNIKNLFSDAFNWLIDAGRDVLKGLANGILTAAEDTIGHVPIIGDKIVNSLKDALDVHSPSRITHQMGRDFIQGFADGVDAAHPGLLQQLTQVGKTAADATLRGLNTPTVGTNLGGVLPGYSTPGANPGLGGPGSTAPVQVFQIRFDVAGSVVSQDNFFNQFRNWLVQQGLHQGGNYIGAGSNTV